LESKYQKRNEKLEDKRLEAFHSRNALKYMTLCNELGVKPEDTDLYEQGHTEWIIQKEKKSDLEEKLKVTNELNFINESEYINHQDWSVDTDIKKELMEQYFPERFGPGEVQDLEMEIRKDIKKYRPGEIGKIFNSLVEFYKKRQEEN
jgi:tRNA U34 5-carboxymethylaminomethyl modifying enzyme MnmG/GidA